MQSRSKLALLLLAAGCVPSREVSTHQSSASPSPGPASSAVVALLAPSSAHDALVPPNPRVSADKHIVGRSDVRYSEAKSATDGDSRTSWTAGHPSATAPAWLAIDIGVGPTRLLFAWSAAGSFNYEETDYGSPGSYRIETSADSSDGADGTWTSVAAEPNVATHAQMHSVPFSGRRWVRLVVTSAPAISPNGVQITEVDVYDASLGMADTWFFMGDSVTAFAFADGESHRPGFASLIHRNHPSYFPAIVNGGDGGAKSDDGVAHIDEWLARNPDAHFWGIGYGTNDSAGDTTDTSHFRNNMETLVQRVRAAGRVPILATIPFANDGQHANIPSFNRVIDDLRAEHGLTRGPDLYAWFLAHPEDLRDHLHPNDAGIIAINRLWAEAVDGLYAR
jgi:acyl-CoA thioesterase I